MNTSVNASVEDCSLIYSIVNIGFSGTFCTVGIAANIACIFVFYKYNNLAGTLISLLRALAWADLGHLFFFSVVIVWPNFIYVCFGDYLLENGITYLYVYVWPFFPMLTSLNTWLLVAVSIHRYVAVINPLHHATFSSPKYIYIHITLISLTSFILELPRFFEMTVLEVVDPATNETSITWAYTDLYLNTYYQLIYKNIIALGFKMYLPMVIIIYTSIGIIASMHKRNKVHTLETARGKQRETKITKTMLAIMITFIVTKVPVCIYPIARIILPTEKKTYCSPFNIYALIGDSFSLINSCANFFIYMVTWQSFRDRLVVSCCCCCGKKRSATDIENSLSITVQGTTSTQREIVK